MAGRQWQMHLIEYQTSNLRRGSMTHPSHDIRGEKECSNCGRPLWPLHGKNIDGTRGTQHAESITTPFIRDANMHLMLACTSVKSEGFVFPGGSIFFCSVQIHATYGSPLSTDLGLMVD